MLSVLRSTFYRGLSLSLALFYGWIVVLANLVRYAIRGKQYWQVKERPLPPKILTDAAYGRHAYLKLKGGIKIHYVENGDKSKPLMVFVHGFPEFWFAWRHQMKYFAKTHWVVAMDLRGYGDSEKPSKVSDYGLQFLVQDVVGLIKGLGREKCTLVGHDWGGSVAWHVAMHVPQVVEKLVIVNSPHPTDFGVKVTTSVAQFFKSWYIFFFKLPFLPEMSLHTDDSMIFEKMLVDAKGKVCVSKEEIEAFKYTFNKRERWTPPINYYRANLDFFTMLENNKYPTVKAPTLIIWGEKDIALSKDFPQKAQQHVPNLTIYYIPEGTHFVQEERPAEFNAALAAFLKN